MRGRLSPHRRVRTRLAAALGVDTCTFSFVDVFGLAPDALHLSIAAATPSPSSRLPTTPASAVTDVCGTRGSGRGRADDATAHEEEPVAPCFFLRQGLAACGTIAALRTIANTVGGSACGGAQGSMTATERYCGSAFPPLACLRHAARRARDVRAHGPRAPPRRRTPRWALAAFVVLQAADAHGWSAYCAGALPDGVTPAGFLLAAAREAACLVEAIITEQPAAALSVLALVRSA